MADDLDGPEFASRLVAYDPGPLANAIHAAILAYWKTQGIDAATDDDPLLKVKTLASMASNVAGIASTHPDPEQPLGMLVAFVRTLFALERGQVADVVVGVANGPPPSTSKH